MFQMDRDPRQGGELSDAVAPFLNSFKNQPQTAGLTSSSHPPSNPGTLSKQLWKEFEIVLETKLSILHGRVFRTGIRAFSLLAARPMLAFRSILIPGPERWTPPALPGLWKPHRSRIPIPGRPVRYPSESQSGRRGGPSVSEGPKIHFKKQECQSS